MREPTKFEQKVYELCSQIPKGKISSYKEIAKALNTKAYRAIGMALSRNPYAPKVPCHRVVKSNGELGGFMGKKKGKEIAKKIVLLRNEGVETLANRIKDFEEKLFQF